MPSGYASCLASVPGCTENAVHAEIKRLALLPSVAPPQHDGLSFLPIGILSNQLIANPETNFDAPVKRLLLAL